MTDLPAPVYIPETIAAISTGAVLSAIGIVRLSGDGVIDLAGNKNAGQGGGTFNLADFGPFILLKTQNCVFRFFQRHFPFKL